MKQRMILIFLLSFIWGTFSTNAQIRGILREATREAIRSQTETEEQKAEDEINAKKERTPAPSPFERRMEERMMKAMGFADLDFEDQYNFNSNMIMNIDNYDSEEEEESSIIYTMYFGDNHESFAMRFSGINHETGKDEQSLMIFDMKNDVMLILTESEDQKNGMAFSFASDNLNDDSQDGVISENYDTETLSGDDIDNLNLSFNKTGRTKPISGYSCDEYLWEDETTRAEYWISTDAHFDYSRAYGYMGGLQVMASGIAGLNGIIMEYNLTDKETDSWSRMVVKEINENTPNTIDVTGFSVIGFAGKTGFPD